MDEELLRELGLIEPDAISALAYAQKCVTLYEETLRAMGIPQFEPIGQAISNSQVAYSNTTPIGGRYADFRANHRLDSGG